MNDNDEILRAHLKRSLSEAPENPFLERRIWAAIEASESAPAGQSNTRLLGWIAWNREAFSRLTAGLGAAAAVLIAVYLQQQPELSGTAAVGRPVVAASPAQTVDEDLLEGLSTLTYEAEEEVFSALYGTI